MNIMNAMKHEYTYFRIWKSTLSKLRKIYGETEEPMIRIVDRLVTQELARIQSVSHEPVVRIVTDEVKRIQEKNAHDTSDAV